MKLNLARTKELVDTNVSSIYTKQDVLNLLDNLDMGTDMNSITNLFKKIKSEFEHGLTFVREQIVDVDGITFELDGNKIYVDDVPVDMDIISNVLDELLDELETNLEDNNN